MVRRQFIHQCRCALLILRGLRKSKLPQRVVELPDHALSIASTSMPTRDTRLSGKETDWEEIAEVSEYTSPYT